MSWTERYGPWALVAGASEGLGRAWSLELARRGLPVVLVARREGALQEVAAEVRALGVEAHVVALDLGADDVVARLREGLDSREVGMLVYNACFSRVGAFLDLSEEERLTTVDVNVRGPVRVVGALAPAMVARGRGGIVIMSSMSGFQGSAFVGTYAATKAFDTVFAEVLWEELGPRGVDVLACVAGATSTPAFERVTPAARRALARPGAPEQVVTEALAALGTRGPTWVCGRTNRWASRLLALLPRRRAVRLISQTTRRMYEDAP
ncbi:MAG: SDR family NAD(P)-dependent oxidoreductase [Alphaproteobacteria bacterium]|nr:SDR family NAD(P)-dependent oxidoreductase [Alphaproteobacteria bacterium]